MGRQIKKRMRAKKTKEEELEDEESQEEEMSHQDQGRRVRFAKSTTTLGESPKEYDPTHSTKKCPTALKNSDKSCLYKKIYKILDFDNKWGKRQILQGECLDHSLKGGASYFGVDLKTGEEVSVTEWTIIACAKPHSTESIQKDVDVEFKCVESLRHPNLVRYININQIENEDVYTIQYLQEFVAGTTISSFLSKKETMDLSIIRRIAQGVLPALQYLHDSDVYHGYLRPSNIHIDNSGIVKLSDYSLFNRCYEFYHQNSVGKRVCHGSLTCFSAKERLDLYELGMVLLCLMNGRIIRRLPSDWMEDVEEPELRDFLTICLAPDFCVHWTARRLQFHSFIRTPLNKTLQGFPQQKNDKLRAEIVVCCTGNISEREGELVEVLHTFDEIGFGAAFLEFNTDEEVLDFCRENSIPYAVILRPEEKGIIRSFECAPYRERVLCIENIKKYFQRQDESELSILRMSKLPLRIDVHFIFSSMNRMSKKECKFLKHEIMMQMIPMLNDLSQQQTADIFAVILDPAVMSVFKRPLDYQFRGLPFGRSICERFEQQLNHKKYIGEIFHKMRTQAKKRSVVRGLDHSCVFHLYNITHKYSVPIEMIDIFDFY